MVGDIEPLLHSLVAVFILECAQKIILIHSYIICKPGTYLRYPAGIFGLQREQGNNLQ